jgi:hypothetical protein
MKVPDSDLSSNSDTPVLVFLFEFTNFQEFLLLEMLNKVMEKLNKTIDKNIPKRKLRNTKGSIPLSKETVRDLVYEYS